MHPFLRAPAPEGPLHLGAAHQQDRDGVGHGAPPMRGGRRIQRCVDRLQRSQQSSDHVPARRVRIVILQPPQVAHAEFPDGPDLVASEVDSGVELMRDER